MPRSFVIGDIHGCYKTLKKLLFERLKIEQADAIYFLGDYIDRGHDSRAVIDFILGLQIKGFQIFTLRGNHEEMLMNAVSDDLELYSWLNAGGDKTLQSFGIHSLADLPDKYLFFFEQTQMYIQTKEFVFVHAGLNFNKANIYEDTDAMLWERKFSSFQPALKDKLLIHGHTPVSLSYMFHQTGNCINIDGGCVYSHYRSFGYLVAFSLEEKSYIPQKNCE